MKLSSSEWASMAEESLSKLVKMCPPPNDPIVDMDLVSKWENEIEISLPEEYKKLFQTYGFGAFHTENDEEYWIFGGLFGDVAERIETAKYMFDPNFGEDLFPSGGFPDNEPGLFSFGQLDGDQEMLLWGDVRRSINNPIWPIYVFCSDEVDPLDKFELPVTTFIERLINGEITGNHVREDRTAKDCHFSKKTIHVFDFWNNPG